LYETALETVTRVLGDSAFFLNPTLPSALNVSLLEIFGGEGSTCTEQLDHSLGQ
jgi:hypothetical protein